MESGMGIGWHSGRLLEPATQLGDGPADRGDLGPPDTAEDRAKQVGADGVDLFEHPAARVGHADHHDAAVLRDPGPFDEPAFLDAIDQAGRVRQGHLEHIRQPAHRHLAVALERVHDVELGHADAHPDQPFARRALDLVHRGPEVGDDWGVRVVRDRAHGGGVGRRLISSYHVNNLIGVNHRVNLNR